MLLRTLGRVELVRGDGEASDEILLPFGKPLAVLIYLSAAPLRAASRDELVDLLWADSEPERARASLRQALTQLRQVLGHDALESDGASVVLRASVPVDRETFLNAIAQGDHATAAEIHRGPFLPDLAIPGGREFEEWGDLQRESIRASFHRAMESLVLKHLDAADFRTGKFLAYRLRNDSPSRERSWRLLLEALLAGQDVGTAQIEADALERVLEQSDIPPEPATRELLTRVRHAVRTDGVADHADLRADLVGRDSEFSLLVREWKSAGAGKFRHVAIVAPAGFGKTRLLDDFRARLRSQRARVASVRAHPGERHVEHALSSELARTLVRFRGASAVSPLSARALIGITPSVAEAFPERGFAERVGASANPADLVAAFCDLLDAISAEVPTTLLIDDLHWADDSSRQLLQSILGRLNGESLLVVTASRNSSDSPSVADCTVQVPMTALAPDDVTMLVAGIASMPETQWMNRLLDAVRDSSAGSPYVVVDYIGRLLGRGVLRIREGRYECDDESALARYIGSELGGVSRLRDLTTGDARILLMLCVAGVPLNMELMGRCAAEEVEVVERGLLQLSAARLTTPIGNAWTTAHDMVRDAVLADTAESKICVAHGELGLALRQLYRTDATWARPIAQHLFLARDDKSLRQFYREVVVDSKSSSVSASLDETVHTLLGDYANATLTKELVASLPLRMRHPVTRFLQVSVALPMMVVGLLLHLALTYPTRLVVQDRDWIIGPDIVSGGKLVFPTPVVELRNVFGGLVQNSGDTIVARPIDARVHVTGDTAIPVVGGRAAFTRLGVVGPWSLIRGVSFVDRQKARADTIKLIQNTPPRLVLNWARINGVLLHNAADSILTHPNERIAGQLETTYQSNFGAATVVMGMTPTWGRPESSGQLAGYLLANAGVRVRQDSVNLVAPAERGIYFIVFAYAPETDERYVLSATNWTVGAPRWGNGDDLASWGIERLTRASKAGHDSAWIPAVRDGHEEHRWQYYGITGVTVVIN